MSDRKTHKTAGAVVCGGVNLALQLHKLSNSPQLPRGFCETVSRIIFLELGVFAATGWAILGELADVLEPATNPNHRAFFHSVCFAGAVLYWAFGEHSQKWQPDDRWAIRAAALSYVSHPCLDSGSAKGLPAI